jgi:ubiquinone/menaquinone biosynthesis C-methylase UbiE
MDAAVYRPAETEGREPVNQIPPLSKSGAVGLSKYTAAPSVAPAYVSVEEGYERWAPTYDHAPNPLLHLEERKLTPLLPELNGKHVLDLACGTGRWLQKLAAQGAGLRVGVDFSTAMLRVAGSKSAISGRLARADCQSLPFQDSVFDLVVCSFALGHVHELGAMVRELARVTKTGADVFVSDLHPEAYARGWRTGFRDSRSAIQIEMSPRTAEQIVRVFHTGGFECLTHIPLCVGEPEKPIFARAGKANFFEAACRIPAVLVCHFRGTGLAIECGGAR